jgi:hypothetical protein
MRLLVLAYLLLSPKDALMARNLHGVATEFDFMRNEQCCFCDNAADIKSLFITRAWAAIDTALANQIQYSADRGVPSHVQFFWGGGFR